MDLVDLRVQDVVAMVLLGAALIGFVGFILG